MDFNVDRNIRGERISNQHKQHQRRRRWFEPRLFHADHRHRSEQPGVISKRRIASVARVATSSRRVGRGSPRAGGRSARTRPGARRATRDLLEARGGQERASAGQMSLGGQRGGHEQLGKCLRTCRVVHAIFDKVFSSSICLVENAAARKGGADSRERAAARSSSSCSRHQRRQEKRQQDKRRWNVCCLRYACHFHAGHRQRSRTRQRWSVRQSDGEEPRVTVEKLVDETHSTLGQDAQQQEPRCYHRPRVQGRTGARACIQRRNAAIQEQRHAGR